MTRLDVIGDVHGCAHKLRGLLAALGYKEQGGTFLHPTRQVVFVGDLIDRGVEVVQIARRMFDEGNALVAMGNHEFNAVAFATPDPTEAGEYLRPHLGDRNE